MEEGKGKGCRVPSTDLQGLWGAARHPSHEGYLLLQVVEPVAQLGLAGAEHEKWGGQRACGGGTKWARPGAHRRGIDSIFKSRDITSPTKVCLVKAMVFPVVMETELFKVIIMEFNTLFHQIHSASDCKSHSYFAYH